jgi:general secretion pathway protein M
VAIGITLFVTSLWLPMARDIQQLRSDVPRTRDQLVVMRAQAAQAKQLRGGSGAAKRQGSVVSYIEQSAQANGLKPALHKLEAEGSNGARLTFDSVSFNELVRWLAELQQQGGLRAETAQFESLTAPGMVKVQLLLRAAT